MTSEVIKIPTLAASREKFRQKFLEWLCQQGNLSTAKAIAELSDRDFDKLCLLTMEDMLDAK